MYKLSEALQIGGIETIGFLFSLFEEDSQYVQLRRTKMKIEAKSYPMLERKVRNPVIKESFEIRMEQRVKDWEQHEKKVFGDAEWSLLNQTLGGCSSTGERSVCIREVAGSTPVSSTTGELDEMENKTKNEKRRI